MRVCVGGPQEADKSQVGQAVTEHAKETCSEKSYLSKSAPSFVTDMTLFCLTVGIIWNTKSSVLTVFTLSLFI